MIRKHLHTRFTACVERTRGQAEVENEDFRGWEVPYAVWEVSKRRVNVALDRVQEEWNR